MRKLSVALLALFIAGAAPVTAQAQELAVGVTGGLIISDAEFEGSLLDDTSSQTNWNVGLVISALISKNVGLHSGVTRSKKGFDGQPGSVSLDLTYFEIPILLALRIPGSISPHVLGGVFLSLESGCKISASSPTIDNENCDDLSDNIRTKGADFGAVFGGGVELDVPIGALFFDVLYNIGLTDISEFSDNVDTIKNRSFYLQTGLLFPIGGERVGAEPRP